MGVKDQTLSQSEPEAVEESTPETEPVADTESQAPADEAAATSAPSLDLIFEILKNSRRREVIKYLRESEGRVALGELAEHVAAVENDITVSELSSSQRKRVYVGLYQCHLPKMDDIGVVEFNQDRGHVELTEMAIHFERYLDQSQGESTLAWYRYYAGISALGVAVLGVALTGVLSAGLVYGLLGVFVLLASGLSGLHWLSERERER